jgi:hypothetical protein
VGRKLTSAWRHWHRSSGARAAQQLFGHWKDASAINSGWIER